MAAGAYDIHELERALHHACPAGAPIYLAALEVRQPETHALGGTVDQHDHHRQCHLNGEISRPGGRRDAAKIDHVHVEVED